MRKRLGTLGLALVLAAGCCQNPGLFQKVQRSLETVQSYYSPLLEKEWQNDERLRRAVVAADTTLLLAGELQRQWCPEAAQAEQLELQAREAQALARTAGVTAAADSGK
jgi:hypothetical protein